MNLIQTFVVLFGIFALVSTIIKFRRSKITRNEAFFWAAIWAALSIVAISPRITTFFADLLNIGRGADVVLYTSVIILFYVVFLLYSKLEKTEKEITKLVRKIAVDKENKKQKQ